MTYLLFIKRLDEMQTVKEKKAHRIKQPVENPIFNSRQQKLRWSRFKDLGDPGLLYTSCPTKCLPSSSGWAETVVNPPTPAT